MTVRKAELFQNALLPIVLILAGKLRLVKLLQLENAELPIVATRVPRFKVVSPVHPLNALDGIAVSPFPVVTV